MPMSKRPQSRFGVAGDKHIPVQFDNVSFSSLFQNSWEVFEAAFNCVDDITDVLASGDSAPPEIDPQDSDTDLEDRTPDISAPQCSGSTPPTAPDTFKRTLSPTLQVGRDSKRPNLQPHSKNRAANQRKRNKEARQKEERNGLPKAKMENRARNSSNVLSVSIDYKSSKVVESGYTSYAGNESRSKVSKEVKSLKDILDEGYRLIDWDEIESRPLVNDEGRVIAVLAGRPNDAGFVENCAQAVNMMKTMAKIHRYRDKKHARGCFPAVHAGFSYGNGMTQPGFIGIRSKRATAVVKEVCHSPYFSRIVRFQNQVFHTWAPDVYEYVDKRLQDLFARLEKAGTPATKPFPESLFTMFTINFGPYTWTYKHRDVMNLAYAWCCITALGDFDPLLGGHLVLHDLKLVIVFPPCATILIPSAILAHSNIPSESGYRGSFTQYIPGGLLRWVDQGFQVEEEFKERDPEGYHEWLQRRANFYSSGLSLYSKYDELPGTEFI